MTHSPTFTAVEPHPHPRFAAYMHIDVLLEESIKTTLQKSIPGKRTRPKNYMQICEGVLINQWRRVFGWWG
jgi:hypothetical protein